MRNRSVAAVPLLDNQHFILLGELFAIPFHWHRRFRSPSITDFMSGLRTIAGLGLTASLVDDFPSPYQIYLNEFVHAGCGRFREDPGVPELWGNRMAKMVEYGLGSFRRIGYPPYYAEFFNAIESCLNSMSLIREGDDDRGDEVKALLALFPNKPRRNAYY